MKPRFLILFALLTVGAWAPLPSRAGGETPVNSYTVVDLGRIGGAGTLANGLNDAGHVVGSITVGGYAHAFLWQNGALRDLGTLGGPASVANAINNYDQVAGWSYTAGGQQHAFLWDPMSGMRDLGTLGGTASAAYGINNAGQVVGTALNGAGTARAFLWQSGRMVDLGVPDTYGSARGWGINASGQVVGQATTSYADLAFGWTPTVPHGTSGSYTWLDPLWGNWAQGINGAGDAVGAQRLDWASAPKLWDSAGDHDLPLLPGGYDGVAYSINDSRRIVGYSRTYDEVWGDIQVACVWDGLNGPRDLNVLTGGSAGLPLRSANGINAPGQIIANTESSAQGYSACLLTPSPVPARPMRLGQSAGSPGVNLAWDATSGADYYNVKRAATRGGPYATIAPVPGTAYADAAGRYGSDYYVVSAVNAYGESADSLEARALPAAPTGLTAVAGTLQVTLAWNASAGADGYVVLRGWSSGGPYDWRGHVSGTTFTDTDVAAGTPHYYVVVAANTAGKSGYSNEVSAMPTAPPPPAAPTNLTAATGKGKRQVDLKWTQSSSPGVTQNRIYRSTTSGGGYALRATISAGTSFSDTSVTSRITYSYVVTAVDNHGLESATSDQASATPR